MSRHRAGRPTIHDVAARAGVSHQTVSRVLNHHPAVRPPTRDTVEAAMRELGYSPSLTARSLVMGRATTIGVLAIGTHHSGPRQMLSSVETTARRFGYGLALVDVPSLEATAIRDGLNALTAQQVAGIIMVSPVEIDVSRLEAIAERTPIVLVDAASNSRLPYTTIDQYGGARLAAEHLLSLGHRKLGILHGPTSWNDAQLRRQGWHAALEEAGVRPVVELEGDWTASSGHAAMAAALDDGLLPGRDMMALLVANDSMALGALRALHQRGIAVPDDLSVVGFDDTEESAFFEPPLTTVRQDFGDLGRRCVTQMVQLLDTPDDVVRAHVITPTLVVRGSTAPAR